MLPVVPVVVADVVVTPLEPVVLVTVALLSFVAGAGEEKMQAVVSPAAVRTSATPAAGNASSLMRKPLEV